MNTSILPHAGNQSEDAVVRKEPANMKVVFDPKISDRASYPFPPSSPEFTQLLVRCFVDGRNAAIDLLTEEEAVQLSSGEQR